MKLSYLLIIWLMVSIAGCRTSSIEPSSGGVQQDPQTLRVGVSTNAPPIIYRQDNRVTGLEAALAEKLGTYLDKTVVFVEVPWEKQLHYLGQGKTDIVMSGMTITSERQYLADFTTPYLRSGQIMLVRMEDRRKFARGLVDLMNTNFRIGTIENTTGDYLITETIANANEITFKKSTAAVEALIKNQIDVLVYDAPMVCHYAAVHHTSKLVPILVMATEEYLAWAVRKGDRVLAGQVNTFLEQINTSGELKQEIAQWIPYLNDQK